MDNTGSVRILVQTPSGDVRDEQQREEVDTQRVDVKSQLPNLRMHIKDAEKDTFLEAGGILNEEGFAIWASQPEAVAFLDQFQSRLDQWRSCVSEHTQLLGVDGPEAQLRRGMRLLSKISKHVKALPSTLFIKDVQLGTQLAGGGYADVYVGKQGGQKVAVKKLRVFQQDAAWDEFFVNITDESLTWRQLKHANVLPFLGVTFNGVLCMVSPWMTYGDINKFLKRNPPMQATIHRLAGEIADGLSYLHTLSIVHGDLRGANILVDNDQHARLADFGLSKVVSHTMSRSPGSGWGNCRWMAPELFTGAPISEGDIWSYACVLLELHTGKVPFHQIRAETVVVLESAGGKHPSRPAPEDCLEGTGGVLDNTWMLMKRCWRIDRTHRPKARQLRALLVDATRGADALPSPPPLTPDREASATQAQLSPNSSIPSTLVSYQRAPDSATDIGTGSITGAPDHFSPPNSLPPGAESIIRKQSMTENTTSLDPLQPSVGSSIISFNASTTGTLQSYGKILWARALNIVRAALRFKAYRRPLLSELPIHT